MDSLLKDPWIVKAKLLPSHARKSLEPCGVGPLPWASVLIPTLSVATGLLGACQWPPKMSVLWSV